MARAALGCPGSTIPQMNALKIKAREKFILHSDQLRHGDQIEIQIYGKEIGKYWSVDESTGTATQKTVNGNGTSTSVRVMDLFRLQPQQRTNDPKTSRLIISRSHRADLDHEVFIDFAPPSDQRHIIRTRSSR